MSTQYTNQAKTAVKYAEKTARRYKHSYIGTEHLLAGLLHEEEGTAGMVLRDMGISEERLMEMIRKLIAPEESNVLTATGQDIPHGRQECWKELWKKQMIFAVKR